MRIIELQFSYKFIVLNSTKKKKSLKVPVNLYIISNFFFSLSFLPETQSRWPRENCQNSFCRIGSRRLSSVVPHMYTYQSHQRVCKIYLRTNACPRGYCGGKTYIYHYEVQSIVRLLACNHILKQHSINRAFVTSEYIKSVSSFQ